MRIGILGGTFDPIHQGHLSLARAAQKQFELAKVLFIPAFIPPHKKDRSDITPAPHRYRMVEMAISEEPDFEISDIEFIRPEISYTVDTLKQLKKAHPGDELFLIMGADSLEGMPSWKEPEEIAKMAGLLAAKRPGSSASRLKNVSWIDMPECPVSSSEVRNNLTRGTGSCEKVLPVKVEHYIRKMKLYGVS